LTIEIWIYYKHRRGKRGVDHYRYRQIRDRDDGEAAGRWHEFRVSYILDKYFCMHPSFGPFRQCGEEAHGDAGPAPGNRRRTFVDSSNLYIYFIDALHLLNPDAKFILTVRNGKDFVRSAFSRRWHEQNAFGTVPPVNDRYFKQWDSLTPIQKNAWIWDYRNRKALEGLKLIPREQKLVLRIEDIDKQDTLDRLESFTGNKVCDRYIASERYNVNPAFSLPPKEEWSDAQHDEFNAIAGELMGSLDMINRENALSINGD
jgi:hypothetical protein